MTGFGAAGVTVVGLTKMLMGDLALPFGCELVLLSPFLGRLAYGLVGRRFQLHCQRRS